MKTKTIKKKMERVEDGQYQAELTAEDMQADRIIIGIDISEEMSCIAEAIQKQLDERNLKMAKSVWDKPLPELCYYEEFVDKTSNKPHPIKKRIVFDWIKKNSAVIILWLAIAFIFNCICFLATK